MIDTWFTLQALARQWDKRLRGATLTDAYSVQRDELSLALRERDGSVSTLRLSFRGDLRYVFRQEGGGKPKRNVLTLFSDVLGDEVLAVRAGDRDRMLDLDLGDGRVLRLVLFGPRANALLAVDGRVLEGFRERLAPDTLPESRRAPLIDSWEALAARWPGESQPLERAVRRAIPLADSVIAGEVVARAQLSIHDACLATQPEWEKLTTAYRSLLADFESPRPCIYRDDRVPRAFSLVPLATEPGLQRSDFESVDDAVRAYARALLGDRAFRAEYAPLHRVVEEAASRAASRKAQLEKALDAPSRGDRYERWGHLLMAGPDQAAGMDRIAVADLFEDGAEVVIALDPGQTRYENAARYYEKARRTRRAREEAQSRAGQAQADAARFARLAAELRKVRDRAGLREFSGRHRAALDALRRTQSAQQSDVPFRRYILEGGYEVWVGRNARQNDRLTFSAARKYDYWLHARGVGGSHAVLRRPRKSEVPPRSVLEQAAAIAAWHSKARGSAMAPVIVAERKFVRKPRGAAPGAVVVEREEVLIVEPGIP